MRLRRKFEIVECNLEVSISEARDRPKNKSVGSTNKRQDFTMKVVYDRARYWLGIIEAQMARDVITFESSECRDSGVPERDNNVRERIACRPRKCERDLLCAPQADLQREVGKM